MSSTKKMSFQHLLLVPFVLAIAGLTSARAVAKVPPSQVNDVIGLLQKGLVERPNKSIYDEVLRRVRLDRIVFDGTKVRVEGVYLDWSNYRGRNENGERDEADDKRDWKEIVRPALKDLLAEHVVLDKDWEINADCLDDTLIRIPLEKQPHYVVQKYAHEKNVGEVFLTGSWYDADRVAHIEGVVGIGTNLTELAMKALAGDSSVCSVASNSARDARFSLKQVTAVEWPLSRKSVQTWLATASADPRLPYLRCDQVTLRYSKAKNDERLKTNRIQIDCSLKFTVLKEALAAKQDPDVQIVLVDEVKLRWNKLMRERWPALAADMTIVDIELGTPVSFDVIRSDLQKKIGLNPELDGTLVWPKVRFNAAGELVLAGMRTKAAASGATTTALGKILREAGLTDAERGVDIGSFDAVDTHALLNEIGEWTNENLDDTRIERLYFGVNGKLILQVSGPRDAETRVTKVFDALVESRGISNQIAASRRKGDPDQLTAPKVDDGPLARPAKEPKEPKEPDPKEPAKDPKEPVKDPKEPVKDPKEPVKDPKEPAKDPKEPDPKEPAKDPKEPAKDPKEPDPKEPAKDPKEPAKDPKEPAKEPDPKEPAKDPKEPAKDPKEPDPKEPAKDPKEPAKEPKEPAKEPDPKEPAKDPKEPAKDPKEPAKEPDPKEPAKDPKEPAKEPEPKEPKEPAKDDKEPTKDADFLEFVKFEDPKEGAAEDKGVQFTPIPSLAADLRKYFAENSNDPKWRGILVRRGAFDFQNRNRYNLSVIIDRKDQEAQLRELIEEFRRRPAYAGYRTQEAPVISAVEVPLGKMIAQLRDVMPADPLFDGLRVEDAAHDVEANLVLLVAGVGTPETLQPAADGKDPVGKIRTQLKGMLDNDPRWRLRSQATGSTKLVLQYANPKGPVPIDPDVGFFSAVFAARNTRGRDAAVAAERVGTALLHDSTNSSLWFLNAVFHLRQGRQDLARRDLFRVVLIEKDYLRENAARDARTGRLRVLEPLQGDDRWPAERLLEQAYFDFQANKPPISMRSNP